MAEPAAVAVTARRLMGLALLGILVGIVGNRLGASGAQTFAVAVLAAVAVILIADGSEKPR